MSKKWIAINLLLLVAVCLLWQELRQSVSRFKAENDLAGIQPERGAGQTPPAKSSEPTVVKNPADYDIIWNRTIFSPDRGAQKDVASPVAANPAQAVQFNPRPTLVGTVMIDGEYKALLIEPITAVNVANATTAAQQFALANRSRRPVERHVGDVYRGFTITSIEANQVVFENGGRKEVVSMRESGSSAAALRAQPGRQAAGAAPKVAWVGSSGANKGGGMIITSATAAPSMQGRGVPPPGAQNPGGRQPANQQNPQGAGAGGGVVTTRLPADALPAELVPAVPPNAKQQPGNFTPKPPPSGAPAAGSGGQRVIRTPFGDVVRPGSGE